MDGERCRYHDRIDEAEAVIHGWVLEFIDHDRPQEPPMTAQDLVDRLWARGWRLVPVNGAAADRSDRSERPSFFAQPAS
jgi:hypothetical protein